MCVLYELVEVYVGVCTCMFTNEDGVEEGGLREKYRYKQEIRSYREYIGG